MDNLRASIELLFARGNARQVIGSLFDPHTESERNNEERFVTAHQNDFRQRYNDDQAENLYRIVRDEWEYLPGSGRTGDQHPLHILPHFGCAVLREIDGEPVCHYLQLLRWRSLVLKLGEDIFTTSFLAFNDMASMRERNYFGWNAVIGNDNTSLQALFREERLSELHFHLKGSTQIFDLSWLSLMNHTLDRSKTFRELSLSQQPDILFRQGESYASLHTLVIWAAAIRIVLFMRLIRHEKEQIFLWKLLGTADENLLKLHLNELQSEINLLRWENGRVYSGEIIDYAIPRNLPLRETDRHLSTTIHHGERQLLYTAFRHIFCRKPDYQTLRQLLYAYLLAKIRLRKEIVQLNEQRIGFKNFQTYENRKECFIRSDSIYKKLICNLAIHSTLTSGNVDYIEARITPKDTKRALHKAVRRLDEEIADPLDPESHSTAGREWINRINGKQPTVAATYPYHYILHFIKEKNKPNADNPYASLVYPRSHSLREKVKRQTLAINQLHKSTLTSSRRIVGIDAANSEINQRPEVFATAYRYLKSYTHNPQYQYLTDDRPPVLGFTYHVGEDFLDMADGLRAVDEALLFLNLECGDRIGHGLILGIDPRQYYQQRNQHVIMSAHDFLDNAAWMLAILPQTGEPPLPSLNARLEQWFYKYYYRIYGSTGQHTTTTPYLYYQAWRLRGDDPIHYLHHTLNHSARQDLSFDPIHTDFWSRVGINQPKAEPQIERTNPIINLYVDYHYNPEVRKNGSKQIEEEVPAEYVVAIEQIQRFLRRKIAAKHILVETNPSSNYLIGEYKHYDHHPLVKLYNEGLTVSARDLSDSDQIHVSIGTDDQGVFATNLENEYSLMALSLEKCKDAADLRPLYNHTYICNWLHRIASMSREHRFFSPHLPPKTEL